jgi:hypothetical protein
MKQCESCVVDVWGWMLTTGDVTVVIFAMARFAVNWCISELVCCKFVSFAVMLLSC